MVPLTRAKVLNQASPHIHAFMLLTLAASLLLAPVLHSKLTRPPFPPSLSLFLSLCLQVMKGCQCTQRERGRDPGVRRSKERLALLFELRAMDFLTDERGHCDLVGYDMASCSPWTRVSLPQNYSIPSTAALQVSSVSICLSVCNAPQAPAAIASPTSSASACSTVQPAGPQAQQLLAAFCSCWEPACCCPCCSCLPQQPKSA